MTEQSGYQVHHYSARSVAIVNGYVAKAPSRISRGHRHGISGRCRSCAQHMSCRLDQSGGVLRLVRLVTAPGRARPALAFVSEATSVACSAGTTPSPVLSSMGI